MSHLLISFLFDYIERYPFSEIRDIYKLLYQSFHGAEHAISDPDRAREWLRREWENLPALEDTENRSLLEPIFIAEVTPLLYRIDLVSAKKIGIGVELIHREFLRVVEEFPISYPGIDYTLHDKFIEVWLRTGDAINANNLPYKTEHWEIFTYMVKEQGYPPVHHSEMYLKKYSPHYRLIMRREIFTK